jgi:hypothetical protein
MALTKAKPWLAGTGIAVMLASGWIAWHWREVALTWFILTAPSTPLPRTELFKDVSGKSYTETEQIVITRLNGRFPTGAREEALKTYLAAQGLRPSPSVIPNERASSVSWGPAYCGSQVSVYWTVDEAATLKTLRAVSTDTGCL